MPTSPEGHRQKGQRPGSLERPLGTFHIVKLVSCLPATSHLHPTLLRGKHRQREADP